VLTLQKGLVADAIARLQKYVGLAGRNPANLLVAQTLIAELKKSKQESGR